MRLGVAPLRAQLARSAQTPPTAKMARWLARPTNWPPVVFLTLDRHLSRPAQSGARAVTLLPDYLCALLVSSQSRLIWIEGCGSPDRRVFVALRAEQLRSLRP